MRSRQPPYDRDVGQWQLQIAQNADLTRPLDLGLVIPAVIGVGSGSTDTGTSSPM
jgi:hypothetical protein